MNDKTNQNINAPSSNKFAPVALSCLLGLLCALAISNSAHQLDIRYGGDAMAHFHEYVMQSAIWCFVFGFSSGLLIDSDMFSSKPQFFTYLILPSLTLFISWIAIPFLSVITNPNPQAGMMLQLIYALIAAISSWFIMVLSSLGRDALLDSGFIDKVKDSFVVFQNVLIAIGVLVTAIRAFMNP